MTLLGALLTGCGHKPAESAPANQTSAVSDPDGDAVPASADQGNTIKVGILHSLSGTMAISEVALKNTALMTIDEINAQGGVLGKKIEPVVVDPASDWPLFGQKAEAQIEQNHVAAIFGCWTSISRKYVLPKVEKYNALLYYPVQYEGQEQSPNIFYTGATPNQQAIPAVEYLMSPAGGSAQRFVLLGTDYVYPRTTNRILHAYLKDHGVAESDIMEQYTPFGFNRYQPYFDQIKQFASGKKTAIISTINGDSNVSFYQQAAEAGITASTIPIMAFSIGESELKGLDTRKLVGHLTAWNYFQSIQNPRNSEFIQKYRDFVQKNHLTDDGKIVTNDPMEATYVGIHLWKQAVEKAGSTQVDKVRMAMAGQRFEAPSGYTLTMDQTNHHLAKPVMIGKIRADGQFDIVYRSAGVITPQPWSKYLPKTSESL